jgi:glycerol-3-phosphate acyltransferase PlsY
MSLSSIVPILFSYLLGSLPFGYLITRFSTGKNILEIGWRKTSGSNVFKNVGKWQGLLTGILDVFKGYLAVKLAQDFGFSSQIQALCGVAAVAGHNWSLFLKLAGGRGIGTFMGVALALSPKILGFSLIPFILLALIWNASIGTILFLLTGLILGKYFSQPEISLFVSVSLLPIFIKRLSPVREIFPIEKNLALIRNRLIFDNDQLCLDLRIKGLIKRLTKK